MEMLISFVSYIIGLVILIVQNFSDNSFNIYSFLNVKYLIVILGTFEVLWLLDKIINVPGTINLKSMILFSISVSIIGIFSILFVEYMTIFLLHTKTQNEIYKIVQNGKLELIIVMAIITIFIQIINNVNGRVVKHGLISAVTIGYAIHPLISFI